MRTVKRAKQVIPPILAAGSARSSNFSCNGVGSGSPWRAGKLGVSSRPKGRVSRERTHHGTTVETLLAHSDDDVLAITVEDLGAGNHEAVGVGVEGIGCMDIGTLGLGLFPRYDTVIIANLLDGVGLSGCPGFIALDIVAGNEDTVTGYDLTGFKEGDITDEQFLDVDDALDTGPDNLDATFLLLVVEDMELPSLLPVTKGVNRNLRK